VHVEDLFGMYTYDIPVGTTSDDSGPSLLILYGDNGSGKTTILRAMYHLLSRDDNRGHRTYLAKLPFRRLRISLDAETVVEAWRSGKTLEGDYELRHTRAGKTIAETKAVVGTHGAIRRSERRVPEEERRWDGFLESLANLGLSFFYLRDDRRVEDLNLSSDGREELLEVRSRRNERLFLRREVDDEEDGRLGATLARLETWFRDEALRRASIGEEGTRVVYADIAKRIADSHQVDEPASAGTDLEPLLRELEERSKAFAAIGLVSSPHLNDIADTLHSSPVATRQLIAGVISPYVDSLRKRLDAQQDLMELVTLFVTRVNQFLHDKSVSYSLQDGLSIRTPRGEMLHPRLLSSGEQQLLALLAEVLIARGTATVFLIDEPEISLNVKWQRMMVDTLLQLVRGTSVQFVLATHSLELLASHRDHVYRLGAPADDNGRIR
jgi:energy-coupling factor transporter ATP-binding protein EcfA2